MRALVDPGNGDLTVPVLVLGWEFLLANQQMLGRHRDLAGVERVDGSDGERGA